MEHKIINTGDYLIIVDDSEIKDSDIFYDNGDVIDTTYVKVVHTEYAKKIIAHLPLNNSPMLEGVPLLPALEEQHKDQLLKAVLYSTNRETVVSTLNNMIKMPVGFKRSIETLNVLLDEKNISFPAKTTNSQGHTQWVGEYIY